MQKQLVLIIHKDKQSAERLRDTIAQDYIYTFITDSLEEAFNIMEEAEPDLIILSHFFTSNSVELCLKIRETSRIYRPVLIVSSDKDDLDQKLEVIKAGADDCLNENMHPTEFSLKIYSHLRRQYEELLNPITHLPSEKMIYKVISRIIHSDFKWALMYLDINNYDHYSEIYGYLAADKMLKTVAAILRSSASSGDFIGHLRDHTFIIITNPEKADYMAAYLNYAFDSVSAKFYSEEDVKRGYLIESGDEKAGARVSFVSVSIGIISNLYKTYENYKEALNAVINVNKLAKEKIGSSWVSDRPKIATEDSICDSKEVKRKILIMETDAALAYLLSTTLEMQGYLTEVTNNAVEAIELIQKNRPDLVLLDEIEKESEYALDISRKIKSDAELSNIKIIMSTVMHDKEKVLDAGVDLYLPKPYELLTLFKWIEKLLN